MCVKLPFGDLNPDSCAPTPHKHLYLWSNHRTKGARWYLLSIIWKHQNCVFSFHHPNSKFWVFEWWKQTSKTKLNTASFVGPTSFRWWIKKTKWYHSVFGLSKQALNLFLFLFFYSHTFTSSISLVRLSFLALYLLCSLIKFVLYLVLPYH